MRRAEAEPLRVRNIFPIVVAVAVAAVMVAGVAVAANGGGDGDQYTGCLKKNGQLDQLAIGDEPTAPCGKNETQITWNAQGPPGEPGPPGADGVSGYERVISSFGHPPGSYSETVTCPPGKNVLSGGWNDNSSGAIDIELSWPVSDTAWRFEWTQSAGVGVWLYIVCATATP